MPLVILDAGHGGNDLGSVNYRRYEKNDNLKLTYAVGEILMANQVEVYYTRTDDSYISPVDRASDINEIGGDLLVSIHRGYTPIPNTETGAKAYLNSLEYVGIEHTLAENILENLELTGLKDNGIFERWYYLLTNTEIPGIILVVGFITSDYDNEIFDSRFYDIAYAIADGIMKTLVQM